MSANRLPRLLKLLVALVVIVGAGLVGVYVGSATRSVVDEPSLADIFPNFKLAEGVSFPDVPLVTEENLPISSLDAVGANGAIVLFVDLGCPPCEQMTRNIQTLINDGTLSPDQVIGIGPTTPVDYLDAFYTNYGLTFPVYADTAAAFMHLWGVEGYPILLVVAPDHTIKTVSLNAGRPLDPDRLASYLRN